MGASLLPVQLPVQHHSSALRGRAAPADASRHQGQGGELLCLRLTYVRLTKYTHFTFTLMAHCTSGAIRGFSVLLKDTSTGNRTSNLLITKRLLYLLYHCRPTVAFLTFMSPSCHLYQTIFRYKIRFGQK